MQVMNHLQNFSCMIKVSVIVPVYNVEKYLSTCLDSLLNQGLNSEEYEIILVNDGSNDNSLAICNNYKNKNTNIFVFTQENQGVSIARNTGISKARGEWIMFVDSDDFICKNSLQFLLNNYCDKKYDCIKFWCKIMGDGLVNKELSCSGKIYFEGSGHEYIKRYGPETFCCTTLYRHCYLESHNIKFSALRIGEDFLFATQFLLSNPRVCLTSSVVYQYLIHPNSASTSRNKVHARKCVYDHLEANDILLKNIKKNRLQIKEPLVYKRCIDTLQDKMVLIMSRLLCSDISLREYIKIVNKLKKIKILPIRNHGGNFKSKLSHWGVNSLSFFPFLFPLSGFLYRKLFVPFVLPNLNRNK